MNARLSKENIKDRVLIDDNGCWIYKKIQDLVAENTSLDDKLAASQQRIAELEEGAKFFHDIENLKAQLADEKLCHAETRQRVAELEQIEAAAKNLADVKGRHHTEQAYNKLMDSLQAKNQRINELESTIKQHGIPVKTYSGGEAHYCTNEYDDLNTELTRLSRIEDVALEVVASEVWSGDAFYDKLCKLRDVLGE